MKVNLYKYNTFDAPMIWSIWHEGNAIRISYGQLGGSIQTVSEVVETNLSGRGLDEQVALQIRSRINKQLDKGYCISLDEAEASKGLNASKLKRPMLAKKLRDVKNINYGKSWLQYKYNGHRCLITCIDGENIAYSRNGKPITSIEHIINGLVIPERHTVDGELYHHGTSLQTIGSWIKRNQEESKKLKYIVYDTMLDLPYNKRLDVLYQYKRSGNVEIAPTQVFHGDMEIKPRLDQAIEKGYEGLMLRQDSYGYEAGNRSSSLLKIKKCLDEEFLVIDIVPSKDDWGILVCLLPNNETFRVSAPGTIDNKRNILYNKLQYIGRYVTVEFFEWTNDGKPFHPVAIDWRT